ncbi:lantibiotic dehydratase [Streptomyces angustmyceticus]|uniref:lantibiotic dehydratase n=1 Tax=Streptomyces angustmyceticus TaxID=285578 RepID=UPI0021AEC511|nr:lantibiotic dehydratase [Streptomyces angustmyceticus]
MSADEVDFEAAEVALLRAAVLPLPAESPQSPYPPGPAAPGAAAEAVCPDGDDGADGAGGGPAEEARTRARIGQLAADPAFRAAVRLASPALAQETDKALAGGPVKPKRLRRLLLSLTKYHLRMSHRATPFGLFAGVTLAGFDAQPGPPVGGGQRAVSRPDAEWLAAVVADLLEVPEVLARARLVANALRRVRDGRLLLVDAHDPSGGKRLAHSVRLTGPVRRALELAAEPVAWPDLVAGMRAAFPSAADGVVERCLSQLVRGGFLLSDLTPPPDCTTPLAHVRERLGGIGQDVARALDGVAEALDALDRAGPTGWGAALDTAVARMRELHDAEQVVQVDTVWDARPVLPRPVLREVERAATVLWRTSLIRPGSPHLRDYHERFLERYGTERAMPVLELLDPVRGLGLPQGYAEGAPPQRVPHPGAERRDQVLAELFLGAARRGPDGVAEVVLDDAAVRALEEVRGAGPDTRTPPASLELGAELVAHSPEALWAGDFHLVLGTNPGSPLAGATFSRFVPALGAAGAELVRDLIRRGERARDGRATVSAAVAYRPRAVRSTNVATVPQWPAHRIPLGVGPAATPDTTDLPLDELAVLADLEGLRLVQPAGGRGVRPVSYSMLNPVSGHIPHTARFLLEVGQEGQEWCLPWNWGSWSSAPAQPRVRYGRTVLSPACWLPDRALTGAAAEPDRAWTGEAARWRRRWQVTRHVLLARADNHLAVDLDDPLHLRVFRDEVRRGPGLAVLEQFGGDRGRRWFEAPDGAHATEFVFPLFARRPSGAVAAQRAAAARHPVPATHAPLPGPEARAHVPGGAWLYAKLYAPDALQRQLLARHVPRLSRPELLTAAGVDAWFFLRYADPDPHLRLRFHGKPGQLWSVLLPELHRWAEELRSAGLADRLVLDTYDPETERYGGPDALASAEGVFHADSEAVLGHLALPAAALPDFPPTTVAALGILHLLTGLGTAREALDWLSGPTLLKRREEVPREQKELIAGVLDAAGRPAAPERWTGHDPLLPEHWADRARALGTLREALAGGAPAERRASVALSLAHMHCNRLLGPHRADEEVAHAKAREGLSLRCDRIRHGR